MKNQGCIIAIVIFTALVTLFVYGIAKAPRYRTVTKVYCTGSGVRSMFGDWADGYSFLCNDGRTERFAGSTVEVLVKQ